MTLNHSFLTNIRMIGMVAILALFFALQAKNAPEFTARDINGKVLTLKEVRAKGPVIVYFWNTCCGLKKEQVEALKQLHSLYNQKGLSILAISEDGAGKAAKVKQSVTTYQMPFAVIIDTEKEIVGKFNAFAIPSLFIIAADGTMVSTYAGYIPGDEKKLLKDIESLFSKK